MTNNTIIVIWLILFNSVQFSRSFVSDYLPQQGLQHTRPPCLWPTPGVYSNSCPLSQWCHPTNSSSVIPFSSQLQSSLATGSFQMSQFFPSGGQSIEVSTSPSVLPVNSKEWFRLVGSPQFEGLSRLFSNTTVQFGSLRSSLYCSCIQYFQLLLITSAFTRYLPFLSLIVLISEGTF